MNIKNRLCASNNVMVFITLLRPLILNIQFAKYYCRLVDLPRFSYRRPFSIPFPFTIDSIDFITPSVFVRGVNFIRTFQEGTQVFSNIQIMFKYIIGMHQNVEEKNNNVSVCL